MLQIVCFKWKPDPGYRSHFNADSVNVLRSMVERHYKHPHEFVCVTDDTDGLDSRIRTIPLWNDYAGIPNPMGPGRPSCYRRLKLFSPEAKLLIGERFVALDLDVVITGDVAPLWNRKQDVVLWGDTHPKTLYNGGMILMSADARPKVWSDFDPKASPQATKKSGAFGSDQAWISFKLGPGESKWGCADGVYSYRNHIRTRGGRLPQGARVVLFHGLHDPWGPEAQKLQWVREHYQ